MMARWLLYFIPHSLVVILCWLTNPIACLFTVRENYRDDLIPFFYLWQTYDNHVDEYWYGDYHDHKYTTTQYNNSWWIRYKYRVLWLTRNTGYGWSYLLFSLPKGKGFQWKGTHWLPFGYINDYNIGWKAHKGFDRLDYAARIIGLRKVK